MTRLWYRLRYWYLRRCLCRLDARQDRLEAKCKAVREKFFRLIRRPLP